MTDPQRPIAHLLPESGWTNDPIGPVRWRGRTHLFSQVNPIGPFWDRPHWGHLVSDDLVHWQRRPIALSPDEDGPDADGCFSGCVVVVDGVATMFYTGARGPAGRAQVQTTCLARSTHDELDTWIKEPANPVTRAPEGISDASFRDPFVWRDGSRWLQMVGAAIPGSGGGVLLYASDDLVDWELLGPMLTAAELPGEQWTGEMWECPALLRTPGGDALLISVHDGDATTHHAAAIIGAMQGDRFVARNVHRFDLGPDLYAPCLHVDPDGRAIVWGWSWEARSRQRQDEAGWAGVLTLPRSVTVTGDHLSVEALPEVAGLRQEQRKLSEQPTSTGWIVDGAEGDALDLVMTIAEGVPRVELVVRRSPDLEEHTRIGLDLDEGRVWLDRDHASLDEAAVGGVYDGAVRLSAGPVELRVVLDRSIVEVFVAGQAALTARIYPTRADSTGVEVVVPTGSEAGVQLQAWGLGSVWAPPTT